MITKLTEQKGCIIAEFIDLKIYISSDRRS